MERFANSAENTLEIQLVIRETAVATTRMTNRKEEWRAVVGYKLYEVSDRGRVRRKRGGIIKPFYNGRGYLRVQLYNGIFGVSRKTRVCSFVHAIVMAAFIGPRIEGEEINHKDKDRENNALTNLEYVTQLENTRHRDTFEPFTPEDEEECPF